MSDATGQLRQELQAAQDTIADLQRRLDNAKDGQRLVQMELEENRSALLFMLEDLEHARRKIEQAHQEWMDALDVMDDPIFLHDGKHCILRCNKAYQQCAGLPFREIIGRPYYEVFPKAAGPLSCCLRAMQQTAAEEEEDVVIGEAVYRSRSFAVHDERGDYLYSVHVFEDITENRRTEAALHRSEEKYRSLIHNIPDIVWTTDRGGGTAFISDNVEKIYGYTPEEIYADPNLWFGSIHPDDIDSVSRAFSDLFTANRQFDAEYRIRRKDGEWIWLHDRSIVTYEREGIYYADGVFTDITTRKRAEAAIEHANRAFAALSAVNRNLVHATNEDDLLRAICQDIVQQRSYRLAWVGYVQHDENRSIRVMARAGRDEGYLDGMQITWAETERGMGPSGRAVRSGKTQLCQDMANDPLYRPWRTAALQRGFASSIALPLANGEVFGILNVYAAEANAFTADEIDLLEEMAGDLAFGVRTLHTRRERDLALEQNRQHLEKIRNSLEDTVRAIATIVEMRDPYTAGHQTRVADLAAAIARQMGLPDEQVHGIHLAGIVHDLGKIQVPAEILSKPGRLSEVEYNLIKVHPQAGYDTLKGIDFPWPIAQMVWQHHERLDGSGYPQGLKGDAILIEARILSVADVVESMSSHRPYRPGMGVEMALEEITKNSGTLYEPQAVDACLALFRERGYSFA